MKSWKNACNSTPSLSSINNNTLFKYDPKELNQWFSSLQENSKGVFLILHGLNLKPSKMNSLSHFWSASGYDVLRGTLSGHFGSKDEMKALTKQTWERDVTHLICHAYQLSIKKNIPLYFTGYSLGAAVAIDKIKNSSLKNPFSKMILLAPAIRVKWFAKLTKFLSFFSSRIMIPSDNLPNYRSLNGTSTAAYKALHNIIDSLGPPYENLNIPTQIFIDKNDELISIPGLESMIDTEELSKWSIKFISKSKTTLKKNHDHLIIDPPTLGKDSWKSLLGNMKNFIESPSLEQRH